MRVHRKILPPRLPEERPGRAGHQIRPGASSGPAPVLCTLPGHVRRPRPSPAPAVRLLAFRRLRSAQGWAVLGFGSGRRRAAAMTGPFSFRADSLGRGPCTVCTPESPSRVCPCLACSGFSRNHPPFCPATPTCRIPPNPVSGLSESSYSFFLETVLKGGRGVAFLVLLFGFFWGEVVFRDRVSL